MTEQERFQRAFAPLHAPSDTLTEVMKMTEQKHRKSGRRTAVIALAAALLLATGSAAYAADLGSIQRRVQLWLHGDQTDAVMTVEPGHYTLEYTDENGETQQRGGGGVAFEPDGTERPLTPEEILEQKQLKKEVYAALMQLPAIQARRIYARFYLGMRVAEIARIEGADRRRVWDSIRRGLKKLARLLDTTR